MKKKLIDLLREITWKINLRKFHIDLFDGKSFEDFEKSEGVYLVGKNKFDLIDFIDHIEEKTGKRICSNVAEQDGAIHLCNCSKKKALFCGDDIDEEFWKNVEFDWLK